jgi:hypothetical protein
MSRPQGEPRVLLLGFEVYQPDAVLHLGPQGLSALFVQGQFHPGNGRIAHFAEHHMILCLHVRYPAHLLLVKAQVGPVVGERAQAGKALTLSDAIGHVPLPQCCLFQEGGGEGRVAVRAEQHQGPVPSKRLGVHDLCVLIQHPGKGLRLRGVGRKGRCPGQAAGQEQGEQKHGMPAVQVRIPPVVLLLF